MYGHSESVLERYSGRHLPASATPNARYFADVMTMVASGIASMVDDNRKGKKVAGFYRKSPPGWWADLEGVAVAMCIFMLTAETSSTLLVSGDVGDHYRGLLGQVAPDLRQLVAVESDEPGKDGAAMLAKLGRITSELADKRRVKLKADMLELGLVVLPGAYVGSRRGGASMAVDLDHPDFTLDHALAIVADVG
jgi:hypothetical protein